MTETLKLDDLEFEVRWSARRKSLQLTVDRGGELIISAPEGVALAELEKFAKEKRFWLYMKLAEKESLRRPRTDREFVNGEGFPYLGRSYRLLLVSNQDVPLKLEAGRFRLRRDEVPYGREHFVGWYAGHAEDWIDRRIERFAPRVGAQPNAVEVRDLGFRWGSRGKGNVLYFHWTTILLPSSLVEYVIVHELVHLIEPNHTTDFWLRLERALPDYEARKTWLAERGGEHVVL